MKCFRMFAILLFPFFIHAQSLDSLYSRIAMYGQTQHPVSLFMQTDKHVYLNNEWIWFSAYIVGNTASAAIHHDVIVLFLVPFDMRKPVLQEKFIMNAGLGFGSIHLSDSILPGRYKLIACTNIFDKTGKPIALFAQDLDVHSITQTSFVSTITNLSKDNVLVSVRDKSTSMPISGAIIEIETINQSYRNTTDKNGSCNINLKSIGYKLDSSQLLLVKVKHKNEFLFLEKMIANNTKEAKLELRFYPESGHLINQLPCRVALESVTSEGEPIAVKGVLFKNDVATDTILTNEQGIGIFSLRPDMYANYSFRILTKPPMITVSTNNFQLPKVLAVGMSIRFAQAITADTARFQIFSNGFTQIKMVIHDYKQVFEIDSFSTGDGMRNVALVLDKLPKGLAAVTLLDDQNNALAERMFYAHFNEGVHIDITPDKKIVAKRQKVILEIKISSESKLKDGLISVSCAQANRFINAVEQDVEALPIQEKIQEFSIPGNFKWYRQVDFLEHATLVKSWRFYKWADMNSAPAEFGFDSPELTGTIISKRKNKSQGVVNIVGGNETATQIAADENGKVYFSYAQLAVPQDKTLLINASIKNEPNFRVKINDPFVAVGEEICKLVSFSVLDADRFTQYSQDLILSELAKQRQLANVTVTAKRNQLSRWVGFTRTNECGDYVCSYNILNCTNHVNAMNNTLPVIGHMYITNGRLAPYENCQPVANTKLDSIPLTYEGIKLGKLFYPEDFSENKSVFPENLSTLYWSPGLYFNKEGIATCSFYTGDIAGKFKIVVNGTNGESFFSASEFIEVK